MKTLKTILHTILGVLFFAAVIPAIFFIEMFKLIFKKS